MISRHLKLLNILNKNKSVFLLGPRGTGKTALIGATLEGLPSSLKIDLLRGNTFQRYINSPQTLGDELRELIKTSSHAKSKLIIAIDEVQKIPALLDEVHSIIEEQKEKIGFILSGSSARKLKKSGANLLAGRALSKSLFPLSILETDLNLSQALQIGTLPGVYLNRDTAMETLESYVSTYLREEIQQESIVRGVEKFSRFLDFAGQMNGEPVNFAKLGKQTGIAGKTAAEYYDILCDTLITREIPGWSHSVKKQLLQASRFYFFDCGVLNSINGYLRIDLKESSFLYGKLFETFVVNQLIAANEYLNLGLRFFYWRDKNGQEVDLVVARNLVEPVLAIEIKSNTKPDASDCPGFNSFMEDYPQVPKICICTSPRAYTAEKIKFLPWEQAIKNFNQLI